MKKVEYIQPNSEVFATVPVEAVCGNGPSGGQFPSFGDGDGEDDWG